eukprot:Lithocolla_globosa_v1_NODE_6690_length_1049_cov_5.345070.p2 type:complete len:141 gc:universal NODE_6690_length_1049_cov_5.345070:794-372(-)
MNTTSQNFTLSRFVRLPNKPIAAEFQLPSVSMTKKQWWKSHWDPFKNSVFWTGQVMTKLSVYFSSTHLVPNVDLGFTRELSLPYSVTPVYPHLLVPSLLQTIGLKKTLVTMKSLPPLLMPVLRLHPGFVAGFQIVQVVLR